jgi:hypothetical protein
VGVGLQLAAASCSLPGAPTVPLLTTSIYVGVILSAAALGWFAADRPFAAVGIQLGALIGATGAIVAGSAVVVAALLMGMAAGAGGALGRLVGQPAVSQVSTSEHTAMPGAASGLTRARLEHWVNAAGLSGAEKRDREHVLLAILARQPLGSARSTDPIVLRRNLQLVDFENLTELPDGLRVGGDLLIIDCPRLTRLPDGLRVGKDLDLAGCVNLARLPDDIIVGRDVNLDGCAALTRLPAGLRVGGFLDLSRCAALTRLPAGLSVGGRLNLLCCRSLTHLPEGLSVGGGLNIVGCPSLTSLPAGLSVGGYLVLTKNTALTQLPDDLRVGADLDLSHCTALSHLPAGFNVGGSLYLDGCTGLTHLPTGLSVGGDLELYGCTGLTRLPARLRVGQELNTLGCARLVDCLEDVRVLHGSAMLRTLQQAQRRFGPTPLQNLIFSKTADLFVLRLPENERHEVLRIVQQLAPAVFVGEDFERMLAALLAVPAVERAALPELCAHVLQAAPRMFVDFFEDVCRTAVELRPARVEQFVAEFGLGGVAANRRYTNVHEGARDIQARAAVKNLWFGAGVQARATGAERTFAAVDAFIESMQTSTSNLTAYLKASMGGQTHLDRAGLTLHSLRARPGVFTLDIASRHEAPLAEVVAMLYNLAAAVQEGTAEQTEAKRDELQRLCVAALSDSLVSQDGATHCAQGVVQRLLTPLQGYYPEVRLDAFEPPTEGAFVTEFARDLDRLLEEAAPDIDRATLVQQQTLAVFARAEAIYAPTPDGRGRVSNEDRDAAAARIAKVRRDIDTYLELADLK